MALLWVAAFQEGTDGPWHSNREMANEIITRLERRGVIQHTGENSRLELTDRGRFLCQKAFNHLIGKPIPATIEPLPRTHLVEEIDGE